MHIVKQSTHCCDAPAVPMALHTQSHPFLFGGLSSVCRRPVKTLLMDKCQEVCEGMRRAMSELPSNDFQAKLEEQLVPAPFQLLQYHMPDGCSHEGLAQHNTSLAIRCLILTVSSRVPV